MAPKRMQTTAAMAIVKLLLTIFNLIFWIVGVAILAVGVWGVAELKYYLDLSETNYTNVPYMLIGTGSFMIVAGLIGCCAIIKNIAWFLKLYGFMVFVVFIALLVAGITGFVLRNPLKEDFQTGLEKAVTEYTGKKEHPDSSLDDLQEQLHCCGVDFYGDWHGLPNTSWSKLHSPDVVPLSCCNNSANEHACESATHNEIEIKSNNGTLQVFNEGCYDKVVDFLEAKLLIIAACAFGFAFVQIVGVILSCCLAKMINTNKYEMM
ncbi:tetraspanin-7-like [Amphiura filiformis]|uniref:tetraspanin-7-like n=1 Tax=Amphiura filiformis TaxID=82378 RepID=UPI003B21A58C